MTLILGAHTFRRPVGWWGVPGCPVARLPGCPVARLPGDVRGDVPGDVPGEVPGCPGAQGCARGGARVPGPGSTQGAVSTVENTTWDSAPVAVATKSTTLELQLQLPLGNQLHCTRRRYTAVHDSTLHYIARHYKTLLHSSTLHSPTLH